VSALRTANDHLNRLGGVVTRVVGTMWCALAFAILTLISLPAAIHSGDPIVIVGWIAQTFLQLVLLSIIMVGQGISSDLVAQKITETHDASLAEFELAKEQRRDHLAEMHKISAVNKELVALLATLTGEQIAVPVAKKASVSRSKPIPKENKGAS
jgi:hypothetical protein